MDGFDDSGDGVAIGDPPASPPIEAGATLLGGSAEAVPGDAGAAATAVPESYALTAPEGFTLDRADIAAVSPVFREIGLSNDQAQALMPAAAQFVKARLDQAIAARDGAFEQAIAAERVRWAEEARADPEIGGPRWDRTLKEAAKALDGFGAPAGSPLRALLDDSGLGNHPEMIRFAARIGRAIGEDTDFIRPGAAPSIRRDPAATLYPDDIKGA